MVYNIHKYLYLNKSHLKCGNCGAPLKTFSISIFCKLQRFAHMKLDTMQDIAGMRVVFKNIKNVENLKE